MKKIASLTVLCLLSWSNAAAQFVSGISKTGTTAASFLEIGVGPRAVAMGSAFVGIADDITAAYWNVAGLANLPKGEVVFMHTNWFEDVSFDYAAVALPAQGVGTFSVHLTSLSIGTENPCAPYLCLKRHRRTVSTVRASIWVFLSPTN